MAGILSRLPGARSALRPSRLRTFFRGRPRSARSRRACCRTPARRGRWPARRRDCISGCAQWWPERTATPSRSSRVARSCACAPSTRNDDHRGLVRRVAEDAQAVDLRASPRSACASSSASRASTLRHADRVEVVDRRAQPDVAGDVRRAGLESVRRVVEHGAVEAHFLDHLAAAEERRHRGEVLAARPQRAGAGRAAHLVAGEGVEVAADRRRCRPRMCGSACEPSTTVTMPRLRASRQISRTGLMVPSTFDTWVTPSSFTSGVIAAYSASRSSTPSGVISATLIVAPVRSATSCHGTMLAWCSMRVSRIDVAGLQPRQRPRIRDQVDREGGAAAQHQFVAAHVEEAAPACLRAPS